MTSPKYLDEESTHEEYHGEDVHQQLATGKKLTRNEGSRFAFQDYGTSLLLFVDGRQYTCSESVTELVQTLCAERTIPPEVCVASEEHDDLLLDLLRHGSLYLAD